MRLAFQAIRESSWSFFSSFVRIISEISLVIIFTQNLGIKEYGYSIGAWLIVEILCIFNNLSIDKYLINTKYLSKEKFSIAFTFSSITSLIGVFIINLIPVLLIYLINTYLSSFFANLIYRTFPFPI